ncbi:unnamed protein product [Euphydryas editha]|uniref:Uncharacterized protein n=1 Tax=Euphydryas editha TaxID=104508 RepID=A0AAU9V0I6_EUPED|nr:unnamed protein product [Euphydryas editha]
MEKVKICAFFSILIISILCFGDQTIKLFIYRNTFKHNQESSNSIRVRRQITNQTFRETDMRSTNANEFKNISNSNNTLDEKFELIQRFKKMWPVSTWKMSGYFTEDYLDLINKHWLQFPPPSEAAQKSLGAFYLLFATVGCWGNVMVIFMYLK